MVVYKSNKQVFIKSGKQYISNNSIGFSMILSKRHIDHVFEDLLIRICHNQQLNIYSLDLVRCLVCFLLTNYSYLELSNEEITGRWPVTYHIEVTMIIILAARVSLKDYEILWDSIFICLLDRICFLMN